MKKDLAGTLYKILGIFAIIESIRMLPSVLQWVAYDSSALPWANVTLVFLSYLVPFLLLLGGGCYLVLRGRHFASQTSPGAEEPEAGASAADIHSCLFSAVGVILIGLSLTDAPPVALGVAAIFSAELVPRTVAPLMIWARLAGVLLPMVLGLVLVFKGSALVSVLRRQRERTRPVAADAQCPHCGFWLVTSEYRAGAPGYRCENCKQEIPADVILAAKRASAPRG